MTTMRDIRWSLSEVTAPSEEPITTAEAKAYANVNTSSDDTLFGTLITSARILAQKINKRQMVSATYDLFMDVWPDVILLPYPPSTSVTSIKYYDSGGTQQTLSSDNYQTDFNAKPARIAETATATWPTLETDKLNAITVRYVTGYADAASVPEHYKTALKSIVTYWYERRLPVAFDATPHDIPMNAKSMLLADASWRF